MNCRRPTPRSSRVNLTSKKYGSDLEERDAIVIEIELSANQCSVAHCTKRRNIEYVGDELPESGQFNVPPDGAALFRSSDDRTVAIASNKPFEQPLVLDLLHSIGKHRSTRR